MKYLAIGLSHHTAPLELREKLAVDQSVVADVLQGLLAQGAVEEAMMLSTCNRVEVFAVAQAPLAAEQAIRSLFSQRLAGDLVEPAAVETAIYTHVELEAVRHMFRVTASLDSLVVGETQITSQVKAAFRQARQLNFARAYLARCFDHALSAAKRVRTETEIARHPASVSSVAVDLACRVFGDLTAVNVLIIGAGEMAELAGRHLLSHGMVRCRVLSRTEARAKRLASELGGVGFGLGTLNDQLPWADVVVTATASEAPIITRAAIEQALRQRKQRTMLITDIAVPRDVEASAKSLDNLYLFDVDDLEEVVAENMRARRKHAKAGERLIMREVEAFELWSRERDVVPTLKRLREHVQGLAQQEVGRLLKRFDGDPEINRQVAERLANSIANKVLHGPTMQLKRAASEGSNVDLAAAASQLFELPDTHDDPESGESPEANVKASEVENGA